jgi:hypothetical protein
VQVPGCLWSKQQHLYKLLPAADDGHSLVLECAVLVLPVEGGVPMVLHCVVGPAIEQACNSCSNKGQG